MRKHILVLALGLLTSISFGQTTLNPGDIVVIAYDSEYVGPPSDPNGKGIYLVTLVDLLPNTIFRISDNYWNGSLFSESTQESDGDGTVEWDSGSSPLPAGTVISLLNLQANSPTSISCSPGSITRVTTGQGNGGGTNKMNLQRWHDVIYVYTSDSNNNPDVFITAFTPRHFTSTSGLIAGTDLENTSFTLELDVVGFPPTCSNYDASNGTTFATAVDAVASIYDPSNWAVEDNDPDNTVDDSRDGAEVELPDHVSPNMNIAGSLPIELIDFNVYKQSETDVLIQWASATEINNDFYEVERAGTDLRFEAIETVEGAIQSDEVLNYEVIDTRPLDGVNYYRLKQVDLDGTTSYFDVRSVDFGSNQQGLVFPNPVKGKIFISGESYLGAQYNVIDLSGAVKMTGVVTKEQLELSAEGLEEGIYFLQLVSKGTTHTYKFSKI